MAEGRKVTVSVDVKNESQRPGEEVVQLYVGLPKDAGEPFKQLRAFQRLLIQPGQEKHVTLTLTDRDLSVWDNQEHAWRIVAGTVDVHVGASLSDIRLHGSFNVARSPRGVQPMH